MASLVMGAIALNVYAVVLVITRALLYRTRVYRPMLWNIWLSILPILILVVAIAAWLLALLIARPLGYAVITVLGIVWLLLLPNASYLITELNQSHRRDDEPVPLWYDIILVITLAMSGVINTIANVLAAHILFALTVYGDSASDLTRPWVIAAVGGTMLLVAFGMYLGRYPRFNSWDLRHPPSFVRKLRDHFAAPGNLLACVGFTVSYAIFLALIYLVVAGPIIEHLMGLEALRELLS